MAYVSFSLSIWKMDNLFDNPNDEMYVYSVYYIINVLNYCICTNNKEYNWFGFHLLQSSGKYLFS